MRRTRFSHPLQSATAGRLLALCAGLALACGVFAPVPARATEPLAGAALVDALRRGGYVIYFRHAATDWSSEDKVAQVGDWLSCDPARVRQLSDEGRQSAKRIGAAMRALGVPVGRVRASEYCRAAETARLLAVGEVRTTRALMNLRAEHLMGGREAVVARARKVFAEPPVPGTNTVLVAHGNLMRATTGAYAQEGGAGIFAVRVGKIRLVALLTAADWTRLAGQQASSGRQAPVGRMPTRRYAQPRGGSAVGMTQAAEASP